MDLCQQIRLHLRPHADRLHPRLAQADPPVFRVSLHSTSRSDSPSIPQLVYSPPAKSNLNPGGYLELCDILPLACDDGTVPADSALSKWNGHFLAASEKLGASINSGAHYKKQLVEAGFVDVVQVEYKWPSNTWPKDPKFKEIGERTALAHTHIPVSENQVG